jgi:hypothetical protein
MPNAPGTPLTRCAVAVLPVLIEARDKLNSLGPVRLATRITAALVTLVEDLAQDSESYSRTWGGADQSWIDLADRLQQATAEYNDL